MAKLTLSQFIRQLRSEASLLADFLIREQAVSAAEVATFLPGGEQNPDKDAWAWRKYERELQRRHAVWSSTQESQKSKFSDADEATLINVLRGAPESVECVALESDEPDARPIAAQVYPKSFHALMEIATLDRLIAWLTFHVNLQADGMGAERLDAAARSMREVTRLYQRLIWIVCSPGCGLPEMDSDVPGWIARLDVTDLFRINAAHHQVNMLRLDHLRQLISSKTGSKSDERPSWTVFFGAAAEALHIRPQSLMRDWALAEVLVMFETSAHVKREAHEEAKAQAASARDERR